MLQVLPSTFLGFEPGAPLAVDFCAAEVEAAGTVLVETVVGQEPGWAGLQPPGMLVEEGAAAALDEEVGHEPG